MIAEYFAMDMAARLEASSSKVIQKQYVLNQETDSLSKSTIEFTAAREEMKILLVHTASSRMKRGVHSAFILVICHARE